MEYSAYPSEQESVLLPGTKFMIINKSIDPDNTNLNIVNMKEIITVPDGKYIDLEYFSFSYIRNNLKQRKTLFIIIKKVINKQ